MICDIFWFFLVGLIDDDNDRTSDAGMAVREVNEDEQCARAIFGGSCIRLSGRHIPRRRSRNW